MLNIFIYDPKTKLLSYPTEYFTQGGKSKIEEPIWLSVSKRFFIPVDMSSYSYMMSSTKKEIKSISSIMNFEDRGGFLGVTIGEDGIFSMLATPLAAVDEDGLIYAPMALPITDIQFCGLRRDTDEIEVARTVVAWLRYKKKRVNNKSILECLTKIYGPSMTRSYKTISIARYAKMARAAS